MNLEELRTKIWAVSTGLYLGILANHIYIYSMSEEAYTMLVHERWLQGWRVGAALLLFTVGFLFSAWQAFQPKESTK